MQTDTFCIIICIALAAMTLVAVLCDTLWRTVKSSPARTSATGEKLSVILSVHDQADALRRNLPALLAQDYAPGYEVIVVDESSSDDTDDVLNLLKQKHTNLYSTFIPESSHYLSRRKLALTLGIKAAKNEWLIFTDADCHPDSSSWLTTMAARFDDGIDMVLGYTRHDTNAPQHRQLWQLTMQRRAMRQALKGTAYCHCGHNLAVRKSVFMSHNGFLQNLKFLRGEYDFMVNEYAKPHNTAVAAELEAVVVQDTQSAKSWANDQMYGMDTRRRLRRATTFHAPLTLASAALHANGLAQVVAMAVSVSMEWWTVTATSAICIVATCALRTVAARKATRQTGESLTLWSVPLLELSMVWRHAVLWLRYKLADKYDFIRR